MLLQQGYQSAEHFMAARPSELSTPLFLYNDHVLQIKCNL